MHRRTREPATARPAVLLGLAVEAVRRASDAALAAPGTPGPSGVGPAPAGEGPADAALAEAERALQPLESAIEEDAAALLARHDPEPRGTGALLAEVHLGADVQQLAELARRIGEIAWVRRSRGPLPEDLRAVLRPTASLALAMLDRAAGALREPRGERLACLEDDAADLDRRQALLYGRLLAADPPAERADLVDAVLLCGYYRRCADLARSAARHADLFTDTE
ncbi:hypothetical protein [Kitasatospora sp. NPDC051914]|uniref:hypothetical protein n=1 Tax=Kitasatospora sp. NPDC051914 TaxID=3154945 RepID=UPI00341758FD